MSNRVHINLESLGNLITSKELIENIKSLYDEVMSKIIDSGLETVLPVDINQILRNHILGIGDKKICISDGYVFSIDKSQYYEMYFIVNYEITYLYKPYQKLDKHIQIDFKIDKEVIRDYKLSRIIGRN